ncbi:hypothetical protein DDE18_03085 [Nocardioides gansuensis]|uniref:LytR/CpsA/Psr regulator C-terminal domain-containing protein n=1 Tax=Nocardioides gansuensis TaxID=2138300 RepID=A0A2T8FFX4_9ACTN|nr:LytR C-terminal domain-containing protein [Nocardioides gansuensis]PVG84599.1 hypothetical protein DDE18_03085 [Nocardioides gansuensis]
MATPSRARDARAEVRAREPRSERGVAFPSPLVMLSVIAVVMAGVAFFATKDQPPLEERITTSSASPSETPSATPTPEEPTKTSKPEPRVKRGEVYVEVFNNSGIQGLAGTTAAKATSVGWAVVGEDNWYGAIPASTVYYPARLKAAAKLLALDLGIQRTTPAVEPMKMDRLTVVLTADAA